MTNTTTAAAQEAQPIYPLTLPKPHLNEGEKFVGVIVSADGAYQHYLILLPGEAEPNNWQAQRDWAASIGGELPDRVESALLFATLKNEFSSEWYWLREQHAEFADCAWMQSFYNGGQDFNLKVNEWRARAVRRSIIQ